MIPWISCLIRSINGADPILVWNIGGISNDIFRMNTRHQTMCSYCLTMKKIIQEIKNLKSQQLHIFSRCTWIVPACSKGLRSSSTCPSHLIMKSSSWLCLTKFVTNHVVAVCEAEIAPQTAVTSGRSNSCRSCRRFQLLLSYFPLYSCNYGNPFSPNC